MGAGEHTKRGRTVSCTDGGRHTRQVDTRRRRTAFASVGPDSGEEAVHRVLATEARSTEDARLDVPGVAKVGLNGCCALRLKSLAGAVVLRLALGWGRIRRKRERKEESRCCDHDGGRAEKRKD